MSARLAALLCLSLAVALPQLAGAEPLEIWPPVDEIARERLARQRAALARFDLEVGAHDARLVRFVEFAHSGAPTEVSWQDGALRIAGASWSWQLEPTRLERGTAQRELDSTGAPVLDGNELSRSRHGFTEWYANGPRGVKHAFVLEREPEFTPSLRTARDEPLQLVLTLEVAGLDTPQSSPTGQALRWRLPEGQGELVYDELQVWDRDGQSLPARMAWQRGAIVLEIDDRDAVYPIVVDPLVYTHTVFEQLVFYEAGLGSAVALGEGVFSTKTWNLDYPNNDAVWFYETDGQGWQRIDSVDSYCALDGTVPYCDQVGWAMAFDGNRALAGRPGYAVIVGDQPRFPGAASILERRATGWEEAALLMASDSTDMVRFGSSVALAGGLAVVGAPTGSAGGPGAVYVFRESNGVWSETERLVASDASAGDRFGGHIALEGDTLLVTALKRADGAGAVYVFEWNGASFVETAILTPPGAMPGTGFGSCLALADDVAVVCSGFDVNNGDFQGGSAWVVERLGASWMVTQELVPSPDPDLGRFGFTAAIDDGLIAVGDPHHAGGGDRSGRVFLFQRGVTSWIPAGNIADPTPLALDQFGQSLGLRGRRLVVGAPSFQHDTPDAVHIFEISELPAVELCDDTLDNDADGLTDCADPECAELSECAPQPEVADIADASDTVEVSDPGDPGDLVDVLEQSDVLDEPTDTKPGIDVVERDADASSSGDSSTDVSVPDGSSDAADSSPDTALQPEPAPSDTTDCACRTVHRSGASRTGASFVLAMLVLVILRRRRARVRRR